MLKSQRLYLRPIHLKDSSEVFEYRSDKVTNKYQGWIPNSIEETNTFINKNRHVFNTSNTWFQLVIVRIDSDKIIGDIGIHFLDELQCELGCTLSKNHQGFGYANEALTLVINYLFSEYKKHRITASIDPRNTNSLRLFERLNFRKEAHFKESLYFNGEWVDDVIYACLNKEWINKT